MSGTTDGGRRAAQTNKERFGDDFYSKIGRMGGTKPRKGKRGFALVPRWKRVEAGRKGGKISRRGPAKEDWQEFEDVKPTRPIEGESILENTGE